MHKQGDYPNKLYFEQLPLYEEGDFRLVQSTAITRYVAKKLGLYPENVQDAARCEMAFEAIQELFNRYVEFIFAKKIQQADFEKTAHVVMAGLEKVLSEHNEGKEYLSPKLSFADLSIWFGLLSVLRTNAELLKPYPKLLALHQRIGAMPPIAAYLAAHFRLPKPAQP